MVSLNSGLVLLVAICHPVLPLFKNKSPEINSENFWKFIKYPETLGFESSKYRLSRPNSQVYQSNIFSLHSNSTILALRC